MPRKKRIDPDTRPAPHYYTFSLKDAGHATEGVAHVLEVLKEGAVVICEGHDGSLGAYLEEDKA